MDGLGIKHHQIIENGEKLVCVCFESHNTAHKHYKLCIFIDHAYQPDLQLSIIMLSAHAQVVGYWQV